MSNQKVLTSYLPLGIFFLASAIYLYPIRQQAIYFNDCISYQRDKINAYTNRNKDPKSFVQPEPDVRRLHVTSLLACRNPI